MTEFENKQERIHELLVKYELDALLLKRVSSFAWATCGAASYINTADSYGVGSLLITAAANHLITNNIEVPRFAREEKLDTQGWEFHSAPWYEQQPALESLTRGMKVGADGAYPRTMDLSDEIALLRAELTPEEGNRFRALGTLCAGAMEAALRAVSPGMSEYELAALLEVETQRRDAQPIVVLVATDDRIFNFRHPLPTAKKLDRYAMLILCGRKWGLVASITRLIHFAALSDELRRKAEACAQVDAAVIAATRPAATLGEIFQRGIDAYRATGFADEWQLHHQGGLAGYEPREALGVPRSPIRVVAGQAFAWNPSITGCKSEDTILVGEQGNEVITATPGLPTIRAMVDGQVWERPAILEV